MVNVIDNTWTRLIVVADKDPRYPNAPDVYYNFVDHGENTPNPLNAAWNGQLDGGIARILDMARKEFPNLNWRIRRLNIKIEEFKGLNPEQHAMDALKKDALSKLTDLEKRALGL